MLDSLGGWVSTFIYSFSKFCSRAIMSVTTTATATHSLSVLADYEVHHSGSEQIASGSGAPVNPGQPADWPTHHRRMPNYRPANSRLDLADRPAGNGHPAEYAFIQIMLHGVWINAVCKGNTREGDWESLLMIGSPLPDYGGLPAEGSTTRSSTTTSEESGSRLNMHGYGWTLLLAVFSGVLSNFTSPQLISCLTTHNKTNGHRITLVEPVVSALRCEFYQRIISQLNPSKLL